MISVEAGKFDNYYKGPQDNDEIYRLGQSFNKMLDDISLLIDKIYKEQQEKSLAELKVLQEQIKPHFLYNTLDNIKWMAKKQNADDVSTAISDLSTFFRLSLNNGKETVSLGQEFKHTKSYLDIQKIRFQDKFSYVLNLDENTENFVVPKIIIQPIVENAINHGIKPANKNCTIIINAKMIANDIHIIIEDDGIGIEKSKLNKLLLELSQNEQTDHYGIRNVINRINNMYNKNCSFNIVSNQYFGTCITIIIKNQGVQS